VNTTPAAGSEIAVSRNRIIWLIQRRKTAD
jgi:hypothetical protein